MLYLLPLPLLVLERQFQCDQISLLYWLRYFLQAHCVCFDNNNDWRLRWKHFLDSPLYIHVCVWFQYDIVDLVMFTRFENGSLLNRSKRWFQQCIRIVTITFRSIRITRKVVLSLFCVVCIILALSLRSRGTNCVILFTLSITVTVYGVYKHCE